MAAGFDVGPANCLMDAWCQARELLPNIVAHQCDRKKLYLDSKWKQETKGDQYDKDGAWASGGETDEKLLAEMMKEPYLAMAPPKSTGKELFNLDWLRKKMSGMGGNGEPSSQDVMCTLAHFTAKAVAEAVAPFFHSRFQVTKYSYVCRVLKNLRNNRWKQGPGLRRRGAQRLPDGPAGQVREREVRRALLLRRESSGRRLDRGHGLCLDGREEGEREAGKPALRYRGVEEGSHGGNLLGKMNKNSPSPMVCFPWVCSALSSARSCAAS